MPWTVTAPGYGHYGSHQPWGDGTAPPSAGSPDPSMFGLWYWSSSVPPYVNPAANATTELYDPSPRDPRRELAPRSLVVAMSDARNQVLPSPEDISDYQLLTAGIVNRFGAYIGETIDLDLRESMFSKQEYVATETRLGNRSGAFVQVRGTAPVLTLALLTLSLHRCSV